MLPVVDSTNAEAARRAPDTAGPLWILGLRQTAGRGRRGRAWSDPEGNFAATLVMRPPGGPASAALRSFVAALALHEALAIATGSPAALALKWPNDVLLNGGKVAGILLESLGSRSGDALAVGIGVNLRHAPPTDPAAAHPPVSIERETGVSLTPEALLDLLAPAFAHWEGQLATFGFAPIRSAWLARAARLGQPIVARTQTDALSGTFETLAEDGALLLRTATGPVRVAAADVFFSTTA